MAATWTAGNNLATARFESGGAGSLSAGLVISGYDGSSNLSSCEEYNGTSYSAGGNVSTSRRRLGGQAGTQTAGLVANGGVAADSSSYTSSEEYDGASWSAGGTTSEARRAGAMSGTQTAGASFYGYVSSNVATLEEYDGAAWASGGTGSNARRVVAAAGSQTATLCITGFTSGATNFTDEYNGASWAAGGTTTTSTYNSGGMGTSDSAGIVWSGYSGSFETRTEKYNGSAWSNTTSIGTYMGSPACFGDETSGVSAGGTNTSDVKQAVSYEWDDPAIVSVVKDIIGMGLIPFAR